MKYAIISFNLALKYLAIGMRATALILAALHASAPVHGKPLKSGVMIFYSDGIVKVAMYGNFLSVQGTSYTLKWRNL